jgi:hypothetical protein
MTQTQFSSVYGRWFSEHLLGSLTGGFWNNFYSHRRLSKRWNKPAEEVFGRIFRNIEKKKRKKLYFKISPQKGGQQL